VRKRWLRDRIKRTVSVHTEEHTFEGVLWEECPDGLVLNGASLVRSVADGGPLAMTGETWIPREKITCVQVLP